MPQAWKSVRVFISSTFRDMQAERDYLVKVVFPELRERMAQRSLHLVDLDLRWGITEAEAEQGRVLEIVLDEITRAQPFFIGILGERYGSVLEAIPDEAGQAYPWLQGYAGHSLTALEIVHGMLRDPSLARRSFFYFRDPQIIQQIPEDRRADFDAESPETARQVAALKEAIRASGRPVMERYPSQWDQPAGHLVGLEAFGERVLDDLWSAIGAEFPEEELEPDPLAAELRLHQAFVEERGRLHVGRTSQALRVTEYVLGGEPRPMVITGPSGCGKSAFLANWYRQYAAEHPGGLVLAYFVGASPQSTNYHRLLRFICTDLKQRLALHEEVPDDDGQLPATLRRFLVAASQAGSRAVLLLDAPDQLLPLEGASGLGWLLPYIPESARLVVSTLEGESLDALRRYGAQEVALPPLGPDEQRDVVQSLLAEWRRKLDQRQIAWLLEKPAVESPLYLRVALEELRLFGSFEQLTARIEAFPPDIAGLFNQVLARLEEDYGRGLVAEALALIGCSRHGLSEAELLELLPRDGEDPLPRALWSRFYRGARAYLVQRGELIGFYHRQFVEAVARRYPDRHTVHARLAAYFERSPLPRKAEEYPFQLQQAGWREALAGALSELDLFDQACSARSSVEWVGYWRWLGSDFDAARYYRAALEERIRAEGETEDSADLLQLCAAFLAHIPRLPAAVALYERALAIRERLLGRDHPVVAATLHNLAHLYGRQGKLAKQAELIERSVRIKERSSEDIELATGLNSLGMHCMHLKTYSEASALYQRALAIYERLLGPEHPHLAFVLNNMGILYQEQGQFAEAFPPFQRALRIFERECGPDSPEAATVLGSLAYWHQQQGTQAQALLLYRRALQIQQRAFGDEHPNTATLLNSIGFLFSEQGKDREAVPFFEQALATEERTLGLEGPPSITISNLIASYAGVGRYGEARSLLRRLVRTRVRFLSQFWSVWARVAAVAMLLIGVIGMFRGELVWGGALVATAVLNLLLLNLSFGLPPYLDIAVELGLWLAAGAAVVVCQARICLDRHRLLRREAQLGPSHPAVVALAMGLAALYRQVGRLEQSRRLYRRVLEACEQGQPAGSPAEAATLHSLGLLAYEQGDYAAARPLLEGALAMHEQGPGAKPLHLAKGLNVLGNLHFVLGDNVRALPLLERALQSIDEAVPPDSSRRQRFKRDVEICADVLAVGGSDGSQLPAV